MDPVFLQLSIASTAPCNYAEDSKDKHRGDLSREVNQDISGEENSSAHVQCEYHEGNARGLFHADQVNRSEDDKYKYSADIRRERQVDLSSKVCGSSGRRYDGSGRKIQKDQHRASQSKVFRSDIQPAYV
jgi:hypothetical protein